MTINEIAKLAGVSISTVSKVINNKVAGINPATRERVLKVVKEYNYRPYAKAIVNNDSKSFLLGVLLSREFSPVQRGIIEYAQENGYLVIMLDSNDSIEMELKQISALGTRNLDGLIWEPAGDGRLTNQSYIEALNIPWVRLTRYDDEHSYHIDYTGLGYFLTSQLINYRHSNIACILEPGDKFSANILEGFKKCLYDNGIAFSDDMALTAKSIENHIDFTTQKFTGIVSSRLSNSLLLHNFITSALNYTIPDDISLVSVKDETCQDITYPQISHMDLPFYEFGKYVCEQLVNQCESRESISSALIFPTQYMLSNTCTLSSPIKEKRKKIVVVGALNMDTYLNVDELPTSGKTTLASSSAYVLGGKGANQAVGTARLGHETIIFAKVGNDPDAITVLNLLKNENISTKGIYRDSDIITGKAYIQRQKDGESTITVFPGANRNLMPADIIDQQSLFHEAGYCLISSEIPIETVLTAAKAAQKHQSKVILKPAAIRSIPLELFKFVDIFVPNRSESYTLCPDKALSIEQQAKYFCDMGITTAIITLDEEGCYYLSGEQSGYCAASDFFSIDTTGAADAFISALASCLLYGLSLEKAIKAANIAAGFNIYHIGAASSMIDKLTLENHMRQLSPDFFAPDFFVNGGY